MSILTQNKTCSFPGCNRTHYGLSLCKGHYEMPRRGAELKPLRQDLPDQCDFAGCGRKRTKTGYCAKHNDQQNSIGMMYPIGGHKPDAYYAKKIEDSTYKNEETGCWEWQNAKTNQGYGKFSYHGRSNTLVHIFMLSYTEPRPDPNTKAENICENKSCANPRHWQWETRDDNLPTPEQVTAQWRKRLNPSQTRPNYSRSYRV